MSVRHGLGLVRSFGPTWVLWRIGYALRRKSGLLKRRFPTVAFDDVRLANLANDGTPTTADDYRVFHEAGPGRFFFEPGRLPSADVLKKVVSPSGAKRTLAVADDYCCGRFLFYSNHAHDLGQPVNWLLNPFNGAVHGTRTHWCDYPTFAADAGDIKDVWEPSRFACAFWLARAYALTGDEKYPEAFWTLFESWCAQNPHNMGPNWKCGQETALRSMAWCFALYAFWNASATSADRIVAMVKVLALQASRIADNIGYAVSQKNNHAFSEAAGLLTTALLFPELKGATRWAATGRRVLEREVRRQVYTDGSYVQQSMNYHRVMLHDCIWAIRLAELNGRPFSADLMRRVACAAEFLYEMLDPSSGRVPNYGYNDGALVLPLSPCDYRDYRATVQAARYLDEGERVLPAGPWDEMLLWLFGTDALSKKQSTIVPTSRRFDVGGYYTLRARDSWCMVRCYTYVDRPAHVDMLHLDLWYKGVNVLGDSGTYRYFAPDDPPIERYFKDIAAHNTIEIDKRGPLELFARWVWSPWPKARCLAHDDDRWQGEHYAYARPPWNVVHRRHVRSADEHNWLVTDDLLGAGRHDVRIRWHLADEAVRPDPSRRRIHMDVPGGRVSLTVETPDGFSMAIHRGRRDGGDVGGWESAYYGAYTPRPTVEVAGLCTLPARFVTRISLHEATVP